MNKISSASLFLVMAITLCIVSMRCNPGPPVQEKTTHSIIIEAEINKYFYYHLEGVFAIRDVMTVRYSPLHYIASKPIVEDISSTVKDGKVTWIINTDQPIKVIPPLGLTVIMKPGDSLHISYLGDVPVYAGNNQQSMALLDSLMLSADRLVKPRKKNSYNAATLEDFLEWNQYLDNQLSMQLPILAYYESKVPPAEFDYYKAHTAAQIEGNRLDAFLGLYGSVQKGYPGMSNTNLQQIWDSTQYKPSRQWLQTLPAYYGSMSNYCSFLTMEIGRKFGFDFNKDSLKSHDSFTHLLYTGAKQNYKGLVRERLLAYILDEQTITEMGLKNPMTHALLNDYYSEPGYPEYKNWVKGLEKKRQEREKEIEKKKNK